MANPSQLFLLADHIKLSLLERQRAISLDLDPSAQDGSLSRSLESMRDGITSIEKELTRLHERKDSSAANLEHQISDLRTQYSALSSQFTGFSTTSTENTITHSNDPSLLQDFASAQSRSSLRQGTSPGPTPKSVRFRDNPSAADEELAASRAALFPYRDEPAGSSLPDQSELSNQQIHSYHAQVLQDQDDQLDQLGVSIGRQRDLSIQIGDELDEHAAMLDDVDAHVDRQQGRLNGARDRIGRIARKANDNKQITTIVVLIIILVLLIIVTKS